MLGVESTATGTTPGDRTGTARIEWVRLLRLTRSDLLLWLVALAWLSATAWVRPLALPDEGRYVGVAWEMLRSGDWAVPTLNGMPFFHKPPLFYWITAASMSLFGPTEMAARAASLLGATMAAMSMFLFVRRWIDERSGTLVLIVLSTTPLFYMGAQFANLDMLVAGGISATIALAVHAVLSSEQGRASRTALAGAFACAALGVLAKGLIGAVLPALVMMVWAVATRRPRALRLLVWTPGLALFVIIAAPWFVLMQSRYPNFFEYFFIHQQFQRFASGGFNNAQAWWFYLPVLALVTLPWFFWIRRAVRSGGGQSARGRDVRVLMWAWFAVVLLFFSIPQSKLVGYILPALPPLAFLLGEGVKASLVPSARSRRLLRGTVALAMAVCVCVVLIIRSQAHDSVTSIVERVQGRLMPDDRVLMVDGFAYDVPIYLQLTRPVTLVDTWTDPDIPLHDNSRRELYDAATFAAPTARSVLVEPGAVARAICRPGVTWIFGKPDAAKRYAWLSQAERVDSSAERSVWRWDASSRTAPTSGLCSG